MWILAAARGGTTDKIIKAISIMDYIGSAFVREVVGNMYPYKNSRIFYKCDGIRAVNDKIRESFIKFPIALTSKIKTFFIFLLDGLIIK